MLAAALAECNQISRLGASGKSRTCDQWFRKPLLYPLSYGG